MSEQAVDQKPHIEVGTFGGVPFVGFSEHYRPRSGEHLSRDVMRAFQALSDNPGDIVHPDAVIPNPE